MDAQWPVYLHPDFKGEFMDLPAAVQDEMTAQSRTLARVGPRLGRPRVGTLKNSKHANMKELRFNVDGNPWRTAFAFDTNREAVLLVAGCKAGVSERRFYKRLIKKADTRFTAHQKHLKADKTSKVVKNVS